MDISNIGENWLLYKDNKISLDLVFPWKQLLSFNTYMIPN
jgi:hypothetical protein